MRKKRQTPDDGEEVVISYARGKLLTSTGDYEFYYPKGLRWGCKRCGECCRDASHRPRRVLLLSKDVERLEKAGEKDFKVETKGEEPFIGEMRKAGGACVYLRKEGCIVYPSRALLCRTYPFWIERNGRSFEIMFDARCTSINRGGELKEDFYSDLIMQALDQRGDA
jgi:Fe-S-cluster containining protein